MSRPAEYKCPVTGDVLGFGVTYEEARLNAAQQGCRIAVHAPHASHEFYVSKTLRDIPVVINVVDFDDTVSPSRLVSDAQAECLVVDTRSIDPDNLALTLAAHPAVLVGLLAGQITLEWLEPAPEGLEPTDEDDVAVIASELSKLDDVEVATITMNKAETDEQI